MSHNQAIGMLLVALGVGACFCVTQLWTKSRRDPEWILRGELRDLVRPGAVHLINALLLVAGALAATGAVGAGLLFLHRV